MQSALRHIQIWSGQHWQGVMLAAIVGAAGMALAHVEAALLGREWLEGLVLAILLGLAARIWWTPSKTVKQGLHFAAKPLLEIAVVLLGASVHVMQLVQDGPGLLLSIVLLVVGSILGGLLLGRLLKLPFHLATLVACGNAICGNSAIAAIAPVINATEDEIAAAVTFTAVGSIAVVVGLPFLIPVLGLNGHEFGALAGMTVYAVPQVLAATAGTGLVAVQTGTLVKLARVLMLGPVTLFFAWHSARSGGQNGIRVPLKWTQMVPPFIIGFALLAVARSVGIIPETWAVTGREIAGLLTIVAMAALGLSSDPRAVRNAGRSVTIVAVLSLAGVVLLGIALLRLFSL